MWIFLIQSLAAAQTCPKYTCHVGGFSISPTCAAITSTGDIFQQVCENFTEPYCDTRGTITSNYTCISGPPPRSFVSYPGEFCINNGDCLSNVCTNNVCIGQPAGGPCAGNQDCDVSLYCSPSFFCVPQLIQYNQCSNDYQCINTLACNRTIFEDGECIPYFSIPDGGIVGMCIDMDSEGVSNLCMSGSCMLINPAFDSVGVCVPAFHNNETFPQACTADTDCVGTNGVNYTQTTCSCGMSSKGTAFCDAFAGDPPGTTVQLLYELHVNSTAIWNCHTQRRFDFFCLRQNLGPPQIQNLVNNIALSSDVARYQENDYCTQAIFNNQFFNVGPPDFSCKALGCGNYLGWTDGVCATFVQSLDAISLKPCTGTSAPYCDVDQIATNIWQNITCSATPGAQILYPGDPCTTGVQCNSGNCTNSVCQGVPQGQACSSSQSCNVGLYCASTNYMFTCQPLIQAYGFGCGSDFDCVNYCGCNYLASGPPGMCIPYFSLGTGSNVVCPEGGISYLCLTGACYRARGQSVGTCTVAPTTVGSLPAPCSFDQHCQGTNSIGQSFMGSCSCGFNNFGASYCNLFSGDEPGKIYLKTLKKLLNSTSTINQCQTTRRFSEDCFNITAKGNKIGSSWYIQMLNFTVYPFLVGNDDCVKAMVTSNFWSNLPAYMRETNFVVYEYGASLVLSLILAWIS